MGDGVAHEIGPDGSAEILAPQSAHGGQSAVVPSRPTTLAPHGLIAWLRLTHPYELAFGLAPAAITLALLWVLGARIQPVPAVFTFAALLLVQAGAHMLNEFVEFERGKRLAAAALVPPIADDHPLSVAAMHPLVALRAAVILLALGAFAGIPLIASGGAMVVALGVLGLAAAVLYSSTNFALKRLPGGEVVVLLALGPCIAVVTALAQNQRVTAPVLLASIALGGLALSYVLAMNLRTRDHDARIDQRTLAVVLPERATKLLYIAAVALAFVLTLVLSLPRGADHGAAAVLLALPAGVLASTGVARARGAAARAITSAQTLRLYFRFAFWLLVGLLAGGIVVRVFPHL